MPRRTSLPPVDGRAVTNHAGGELGVGKVAELPQFLRSTAVLKDHLVDLEGIELTGTETVNGAANPLDEVDQPSLVILHNHLDRGPPLRFAGHTSEATNPTALERYLDGMTSQWQNRALPVVHVDQMDVGLQIQQQRQGLTDLAEKHRADIARPFVDPGGCHGAHVLTLR